MSVPSKLVQDSIAHRADDLDEFRFEPGETWVRWVDYRDARADDKVWMIVGRSFEYDVSWQHDETNKRPTRERHRQYTLCSRTTNERQTVSEAELYRHDWKHWPEGR